jgi:microcompartment protein CcmK/EutM
MELGKVMGTVVATVKEPKLIGAKLLIVNILNMDGTATQSSVVAIDSVGAGKGEVVIIVRGSSARQARNMESVPTDATIIGIVDALEMAGKVIFKK